MRLTTLCFACVIAGPAAAQRQIDLAKPDAAIKEPFTLLSGVRELPNGRAIVTDQADRSVFLVDFGANTSTRIGRQGDGPNEYRFPTRPLSGRSDTTLVVDVVSRRMIVIASNGTISGTTPMPAGGAGGYLEPHGADREGRVYLESNSFDPERGTFTDSVSIVRWNPRDGKVDAIGSISKGGRVVFQMGGGSASMARSVTPFPHIDAWAVASDGAVSIAHQTPFRVERVSPDARAGPTIANTPIAVTNEERQAWRERDPSQRMTATALGGGGQSVRRPPMPDEIFPKEMPAFVASAVIATPEGEVWVGRSRKSTDTKWRYDIIGADGTITGSATLGVGSVIVGFGRGTVYVARTDPADDLVYLERHRR